jgi:hypothetical protein
MIPAGLAKRAREEQVESCLLSVLGTKDTVVVVAFYLSVLSSLDVSNIKPVHKEQPCKNSYFVRTL